VGRSQPTSPHLSFGPCAAQQTAASSPAFPSRVELLASGARMTSHWCHNDVAIVIPSFFPFRWCRHAKVPGSPAMAPSRREPRAAAASWPSTCPRAPAAISRCRRSPRDLPTLAASGENPPLSTPPAHRRRRRGRRRREGEGGSEAARGSAAHREARSRP
jgi:hypothetical protein